MGKQFKFTVTEDENGELTFETEMKGFNIYQSFGFLTYVKNKVEEKMMNVKMEKNEKTQKA